MKLSLLSKYRSELMGYAMLAVIFFHAMDLSLDFGIGSTAANILSNIRLYSYYGVDIFVFLSAVGIAMSLSSRKQEFSDYMSRRAKRLLPAYFIVMIPYSLYLIGASRASLSVLIWNSTLLSYWVKPAGGFNWYVTGIMLLYIIAPTWHSFISRSKKRVLLTVSAILIVMCATMILISDNWWKHLDIIYRVPVFLLGLLIGTYIKEERRFGIKGLFANIILTILGCGMLYLHFTAERYIPPTFGFLCLVLPLCLGLSVLFEKLPLGYPRMVLKTIGNSSLEIYLLNVSLFSETALLRQYINFGGPTNRLYYLIVFAANILLGMLLHYALDKLLERFKKPKTA